MIECNPSSAVVGFESIAGGECPSAYECTTARAYLSVKGDPELAALVGEFPCGKQAEKLYIVGKAALTEEGKLLLEGAK